MLITAVGREPLPLTAGRAIRVFLWYFGAQLLVSGVLGLGLGIWASLGQGDAKARVAELTTAYLMPIAVLSVLFGAWVMMRKVRKAFRGSAWPTVLAALGWRPAPLREMIFATAFGAVLSTTFVLVILTLLPPRPGQTFGPIAEVASASQSARVYLAILAIFLAPAIEEFLFRGVLLTGLGNSWGLTPAVFGVTILFALGHVTEVRTYWPALLSIVALALTAVAIRLRTGSLWPCIGMHTAYNTVLMGIMLFHGSGA